MGLTFDSAGNLYAANFVPDSTLYAVNLNAQSTTAIGDVGFQSHGLDVEDDGSTTVTPEPATWMLIGSGLLALGSIRRRETQGILRNQRRRNLFML